VRVEGSVLRLSDAENDEYFYSRPVGSQLGAIASPQSTVVENRLVLEQNMEKAQIEADLNGIKRPEHWGGYLVIPEIIEFWQGRPSRLHDRFLFEKQVDGWKRSRLAP
jgi:pyridoxamine 5'-phosphate oxidase